MSIVVSIERMLCRNAEGNCYLRTTSEQGTFEVLIEWGKMVRGEVSEH